MEIKTLEVTSMTFLKGGHASVKFKPTNEEHFTNADDDVDKFISKILKSDNDK
jgi:hypothetical protein